MILKGMSKKELRAIISNLNMIIESMKEEQDRRINLYQEALIGVHQAVSSVMTVQECCWECTGPEDCLLNESCEECLCGPFKQECCSKS